MDLHEKPSTSRSASTLRDSSKQQVFEKMQTARMSSKDATMFKKKKHQKTLRDICLFQADGQKNITKHVPSGYLTVCHGKWPIYRYSMVYLLKPPFIRDFPWLCMS